MKKLKEVLTTAVLILGIFAFRSSFAEPYVVPSGSMEPTILEHTSKCLCLMGSHRQ